MEFIIQLEDGQEAGPFNEKQLQQRAEAGEILSHTQLRSKLLKNWKPAKDIPCLESFFENQDAELPKKSPGLMHVVKEGLTSNESEKKIAQGVVTYGSKFTFKPVSIISRGLATVIDLMILLIIIVPIFLLMKRFLPAEVLTHKITLYVSFISLLVGVIIYYSWTIGMRAQTYGQSFFGIMVVRSKDGEPVLLGRAYIYTLAMILFGWFTPILSFITPNNRSVQGLIAGCRSILVKGARK